MFRNMSFEKSRPLTEAKVMRALAHPTRIDLLELIAREGELTATRAAELLGMTPANCSFHLRRLAENGFVQEASRGPGRTRNWKIGSVGHSWDGVGADAETTAAAAALTSAVLERDVGRLREWLLVREQSATPEWRRAAFVDEALMYVTREELEELGASILERVMGYIDRIDPSNRPPDAVAVQFLAAGFPLPPTATGN
jgi:DNA-binding transcriptional ArsR family regulator